MSHSIFRLLHLWTGILLVMPIIYILNSFNQSEIWVTEIHSKNFLRYDMYTDDQEFGKH
jgi:hypothetical protein